MPNSPTIIRYKDERGVHYVFFVKRYGIPYLTGGIRTILPTIKRELAMEFYKQGQILEVQNFLIAKGAEVFLETK